MKKIDKNLIKTWLVTGASSGFGQETCKQLLERGYNVIAVSRRIPQFTQSNALCLSVDVTKPETIEEAVKKGIEYFGGIDVVINHAGISTKIALEDETYESMKASMDTNFYGTFNLIKAILPYFRENKKGTIVCNSSMNGISFRAYGAAYCASKHAVEGLVSVCRYETKNFCRVMLVEPGFFPGTEIAKNIDLNKTTVFDEYKNIPDSIIKLDTDRPNSLPLGVKYIIDTVEQEKLPLRLILGKDALNKIETEVKLLKKDIKNSSKYKMPKQKKR